MILELVKEGKKVGVTVVSHRNISNLLKESCKAAAEQNRKLKILQEMR
ncbi:MAG: hypothetical protein WAQ99_08060 [Pyrinomonadaceae bacterium]